MEPGTGEAAVGTAPEAMRPGRGFAFAAALATFWVSGHRLRGGAPLAAGAVLAADGLGLDTSSTWLPP